MKLGYGIEGPIGTITLSNPPPNLRVHPVFEDIATLRAFLERDELKAVIVRGDGRSFCGGADLEALRIQAAREDFPEMLDGGKRLLEALSEATVPVAAAIRGSCLGAGLEIALACHFRYAASTALLGLPETERGLMPGFGGTALRDPPVRRGLLLELVLSGRMIGGEEARAIGLVDACGPPDAIEALAAEKLGRLTAGRPAHLVQAVMTAMRNARRLPREEALREESVIFHRVVRRSVDEGA